MFCQNNVGKALIAIELYDEAIPLLEASLRQAQALHGYVHFSVEHICQSLAIALRAKKNFAAAYKHWMSAATSSEAQRGLLHNTTLYCYHQAARAKASAKLFDEALPLFFKVLDTTEKMHGASEQAAYIARDTATCLNQLERYTEALPYWRRAFKLFKASDKKEIFGSVARSLNWTQRKIREVLRAEHSKLVAAVEGLSDEDRQYLVASNLTTAQLNAVIEHLKATYLSGDEGDYPHAGDLRVAVKGHDKLVNRYQTRAAECCCGSHDHELEVWEPDGNKKTVMVGFSYGH
jgi:tetratricopeptide (TPR) repeat protein